MKKCNQAGVDLIKRFEQCKLSAYLDAINIPTIGYGHTKNVKLGDTISMEQASEFLGQDLASAEATILKCVILPMTENQFSALVCFVFNIGAGAFAASTMLRELNAGNALNAALEFPRWHKANGTPLKGLLRRRAAEMELFLT